MINPKHAKIIGGSLGGLTICVVSIFCFAGDTAETHNQAVKGERTTRETLAPQRTTKNVRPVNNVRDTPTRIKRGNNEHRHNDSRRPRGENRRPKIKPIRTFPRAG